MEEWKWVRKLMNGIILDQQIIWRDEGSNIWSSVYLTSIQTLMMSTHSMWTLIQTDLNFSYGIPPHHPGMYSLLLLWDATSALSTTQWISWRSQLKGKAVVHYQPDPCPKTTEWLQKPAWGRDWDCMAMAVWTWIGLSCYRTASPKANCPWGL